jgi:SAM-dependent methyltransferase
VGGDIDPEILAIAKRHYGDRVKLLRMDAQRPPYPDASFDVLILYEAIYYLPAPAKFAEEARRILRPGGVVLLCAANKDLPDFNPSPFAHQYFGPLEFAALLQPLGFKVECLGEDSINLNSVTQRMLRTMKRTAVAMRLIPKTMGGKKLLKRLFFGKLMPMPAEVYDGMAPLAPPVPIPLNAPDARHRVIHCVARLS